jgi:hypothetical protein
MAVNVLVSQGRYMFSTTDDEHTEGQIAGRGREP